MIQSRKLGFLFLMICLFFYCGISSGQEVQMGYEKPDLQDRGNKIENNLSFFTSRFIRTALEDTSGRKMRFHPSLLIINGDTITPVEVTTRGKSTLHFFRKSYGFDLKSKAMFVHNDQRDSLKKFFVLSLTMDKYYHHNRIAYEMMKESGIFKLFYTYCDVRINGRSDGVHMVVERPDEWAMKKKEAPIIIRRGYNEEIDNFKTNGRISKDQATDYCSSYKEIYKDLKKLSGEELYDALSDRLDMNKYMKWLAFNFFIKNGDYTDEVYFFYDPKIKKFSVIPWDYDDILMRAPHEGKEASKKVLSGKLLFSAEDLLDKKIATDPYLYSRYLQVFEELLNDLSADILKKILENTYAELCPYYANSEILSMAKYDLYTDANLVNLQADLTNVYDYLRRSRDFYYNLLKGK